MTYQNLLFGGSPETVKSVLWLVICGICVVACVMAIVAKNVTVINRYKELTGEKEPAKPEDDNK